MLQYGSLLTLGLALLNGVVSQSIPRRSLTQEDVKHQNAKRDAPVGVRINSCTVPGVVALTFDDGPSTYTSDLLDLLDSRGVQATFFITGNNGGQGVITERWADVIQRQYNSGHQVASHGWTHKDLSAISDQERSDEVFLNAQAIGSIIGVIPTYYRPAYGNCDGDCEAFLGSLGYHTIAWDIDTNDWQRNLDNSKSYVTNGLAGGGSIILTHDNNEMTVYNLASFIIDAALNQGRRFVTVGECLGDPQENWYRPFA